MFISMCWHNHFEYIFQEKGVEETENIELYILCSGTGIMKNRFLGTQCDNEKKMQYFMSAYYS